MAQRMQDLVILTFDAQNLTPQVDGRERVRCLERWLLEPGKDANTRAMTADEIKEMFQVDSSSVEEESGDEGEDGDQNVQMEEDNQRQWRP